MSLFRTTAAGPSQPPVSDDDAAKVDDASLEDNADNDIDTGDSPEAPVVKFPDGTTMPADQYADIAVNKEVAKINEEWSRVRSMSAPESNADTASAETETKPAWQVEIEDDEFQSDVEKSLVNSHNELGSEVGKISKQVAESMDGLQKEIKELRQETAEARAQRQIDEVAQKHNVTEDELKDVYNEFGGGVENLEALAEIVVSRKGASAANAEKQSSAMNERREAAAKISGGGASQPTDGDPPPAGRGLSGKAVYDGAAIAAKYSAFK